MKLTKEQIEFGKYLKKRTKEILNDWGREEEFYSGMKQLIEDWDIDVDAVIANNKYDRNHLTEFLIKEMFWKYKYIQETHKQNMTILERALSLFLNGKTLDEIKEICNLKIRDEEHEIEFLAEMRAFNIIKNKPKTAKKEIEALRATISEG